MSALRAVWADGFGEGLRSPAEIERLVAFAVHAGLTALVVQVTRRGDAMANDLPLPRADADLAAPPFDPLAEVCDRAHAAGLAVHGWLAVTPAGDGPRPPARLAGWLTRRADGAERDANGVWHLDPGLDEVAVHTAELAAALAARYPVDGVSLDRVRYPEGWDGGKDAGWDGGKDAAWGYHPTALARYAAEAAGAGPSGTVATGEPPSPHDADWQAWRRQRVTALVVDVAAAVRAVRPEVTVSVNGCCFGGLERGWKASRPYTELGQDWVGWLADGVVDRVLAMNYRGDADDADLAGNTPAHALRGEGAVAEVADIHRLRARFDDWARLAVAAGGQRAVVGSGLYLHRVAESAAQAARALTIEAADACSGGWCGFSYRTPSRAVLRGDADPGAEREALAAELVKLVPPVPKRSAG